MNPRDGQFALGGTVAGWVELTQPNAHQARLLRRCYAGREPRIYSKYGSHRMVAAMPWAHTIIKDPFALLSVPGIVAVTGAVPVVIYRPAGAVLAGYRRMGWSPDGLEMRALQGRNDPPPDDDVAVMAEFWSFMHERVLDWLPAVPQAIVVSHAELVRGGRSAVSKVLRACGLQPSSVDRVLAPGATSSAGEGQLHQFDRAPDEVADGWRTRVDSRELEILEAVTAPTWTKLHDRRLDLA